MAGSRFEAIHPSWFEAITSNRALQSNLLRGVPGAMDGNIGLERLSVMIVSRRKQRRDYVASN